MKVTYVDSGILITAFRGPGEIAKRAYEVLDDPEREFASSEFVRLELLPKAIFHQKQNDVDFYETFFEKVAYWAKVDEELIRKAFEEAQAVGLNAVDALHVAAAISTGASELATSEKPEKPMHRVKSVSVFSIQS